VASVGVVGRLAGKMRRTLSDVTSTESSEDRRIEEIGLERDSNDRGDGLMMSRVEKENTRSEPSREPVKR
jgi:hypothetical protein